MMVDFSSRETRMDGEKMFRQDIPRSSWNLLHHLDSPWVQRIGGEIINGQTACHTLYRRYIFLAICISSSIGGDKNERDDKKICMRK